MSDSTQFENTLERLLEESGNSVASRPHFYRELLLSNVLIIPHGAIEESDDPGRQTATLKMAAISHEGVDYVPFFIAEKFLPRETKYLSLPAKTFFEITKGSHLILNPGAQFGKTFSPEEVEKLLTGKMFEVEKEFQVKNSAEVIIGNPKEIPDRLLPELSRFFRSEDSVLRAWLGWYHNPELEKEPGYLLAIETTRSVDFRALAGRVSLVLKEVGTNGRYCDVVQYSGQGITGYFRSTHPFYAKPLWARLKGGLLGW
jgi:hypothetical protein